MLIIKVVLHIKMYIIQWIYKLLYRSKFEYGRKFVFRNSFFLMIEGEGKVVLGDEIFINNNCSISAHKSVFIGTGTLIGENVKIYDHNHRFRNINQTIKEQGFKVGTVKVGQYCWIGSNVILLKGTNIGDHCVIGAGCVIDDVIPSNTIVTLKKGIQDRKNIQL